MVAVYLVTAIGVPVYMHYCGGELEKISYLIKSKGCCGSEEDEGQGMSDCCKDENAIARYSPDFTVKKVVDSSFNIADFNLFTIAPLFIDFKISNVPVLVSKYFFPPPDILHNNIIRTTFLRI
jgi:hypothetical protein